VTTPTSGPEELTVDQLAARVGMTVRNVRAYATRGLLPPPRLAGRTGYYGPHHIARLSLVRQMLEEGYTLAAVERLLAKAPPDATAAELGVLRAAVSPWLPDEPEEMHVDTLAARAGTAHDDGLVDRLAALGVVERVGTDRVRVLNPALLAAGLQVVRMGLPAAAVVEVQRRVAHHARQAAQLYVGLIRDTVWREFVDADMPADGWARVQEVLEQLPPLAGQALLATFRAAMTEEVDRAAAADLDALHRGPDSGAETA
jgi:DNA-binding transcriptional MerR regulator